MFNALAFEFPRHNVASNSDNCDELGPGLDAYGKKCCNRSKPDRGIRPTRRNVNIGVVSYLVNTAYFVLFARLQDILHRNGIWP